MPDQNVLRKQTQKSGASTVKPNLRVAYQGTLIRENIALPKPIALFLVLSDIVAYAIAFTLAAFALEMINGFFKGDPITWVSAFSYQRIQMFYMIGIAAMFVLYGKGLYTRFIPWWTQVQFITKVVVFSFFAHGFLSFALKNDPSRLLIVLDWGIAGFLMLAVRFCLFTAARKSGLMRVTTIIISDKIVAADALYAFHSDLSSPYEVRAVLLRDGQPDMFDLSNLPEIYRDIEVIDARTNHEAFILKNPESFYIISLETFRGTSRDGLIRFLNDAQISYAIIPSVASMNTYHMEPHYFFGQDIMVMHNRMSVFTPVGRFAKRALDITVAAFLLFALAPLFAAVAIALKLEGQAGSVFYGGERMGRYGRMFRCWKFRSMEPDSDHLLHAYLKANPQAQADWDKYRKLRNDPRISTRTARFIRKASIDEIPQLWNVLKGDMSLVGPRPILADEKEYFGDKFSDYKSVKPGITGLWQVSGRNDTSFERRVHWDSWYVRNWSLWGDIVILFKTVSVLLSRSGAH